MVDPVEIKLLEIEKRLADMAATLQHAVELIEKIAVSIGLPAHG